METEDYEPSSQAWVRDQVELYESSGGTQGTTLRDSGLPVIIVTMRGRTSGKIRKVPLMRVQDGGSYALIASQGGAPTHPQWYGNLTAHPDHVRIQDGPKVMDVIVREVDGPEREAWWARSVAAFPPYADYQERTARVIPVLVATPRG